MTVKPLIFFCITAFSVTQSSAQTAREIICAYAYVADSVLCEGNKEPQVKKIFRLDTSYCHVYRGTHAFHPEDTVNGNFSIDFIYKLNLDFVSSNFIRVSINSNKQYLGDETALPHFNFKEQHNFINSNRLAEIAKKELRINADQIFVGYEYKYPDQGKRFEINDQFRLLVSKLDYSTKSKYIEIVMIDPFTGKVTQKKWVKKLVRLKF